MTLPLLLSVPHGGLDVPDEIADQCILTPAQIARDGDEGAAVIYSLASEAHAFVRTSVARAVLDMNRATDDFRKDGIVKTHTCFDEPVWRAPLDSAAVAWLIGRYHTPYHARLSILDPAVLLGVDCHTMNAQGPPVGPDAGQQRPAVCLSDAGGTLPEQWFQRLVECFEQAFDGEVSVNHPFKGGHCIRAHAHERPWVQLELSRAPFDTAEGKRAHVLEALSRWCETYRVSAPSHSIGGR